MKWSFWKKRSFTQKKLFWGLISLALLLLIYTYGIDPLIEAKKDADQKIAQGQILLAKYAEVLQNQQNIQEGLERAKKQHEEVQRKLLSGETHQISAATLQDVVRRISEKNGISLRSFRILEAKDVGIYKKISMQIEFNPTNSMQGLGKFIHEVENQENQLYISDMDLFVFNPRMPTHIQGNLVISGLMKGGKGKDKGGEK